MKCKSLGIGIGVVLLFLILDIATFAQDEKLTDHIIVFDLSYSMYNEIQVIPSDFISCDPILKEKAKKGEKASKVSIGRAAVECYLDNYSREGDRFALLLIKEDAKDELSVDGFCESKEEIYSKIRIEEEKKQGYGLTPLSDAFWEAMEFFHNEGSGNRYKKILFVTDLYETKTRGEKDFCETAKDIRATYGTELNVDSLLVFVMPIKKEDYNRISKCLRENFYISSLIPISTFELSFEFIDSVENLKTIIKESEQEKSDCYHENAQLKEEIDECRDDVIPDRTGDYFRAFLCVLLGIGIVFILLGLRFFATL